MAIVGLMGVTSKSVRNQCGKVAERADSLSDRADARLVLGTDRGILVLQLLLVRGIDLVECRLHPVGRDHPSAFARP